MRLQSSWRATAWVLALTWALVPALAAVHGAVENHVYCAEHNAFEHAGEGHEHSASDAASVAATGDSGGGLHELCEFSDVLLRDAVESGEETVDRARLAASGDGAVAVASDAAGLPVLAVAPKGSPPA